jgi:catechol 2,3-dioxygenase-like lactoylglutathione lyase family enzyme
MRSERKERDVTIRIREIDHVVLRVADMARMLKFYCDVLGCKVERRLAAIGLVQLRAGSSMIDLIPGARPGEDGGRNLDHFALRVEPFDPAAIARDLAAHGIVMGEVTDRYGAEGDGPSIYIHDPEGNQVELKGPAAIPARLAV